MNASYFELLGGQAAVDRIVDAFYRNMDALPEAAAARALHAPDLGAAGAVLKKYLGEWLGGPDAYSRERGHPRLRMRHMPFRIGAAERDAWMLCMRKAFADTEIPPERCAPVLAQLSRLADWMRNDAR